jgi:hypothetical protein
VFCGCLDTFEEPLQYNIELNSDLNKISDCSHSWNLKLIFVRLSQTITFSTKRNKPIHPPLFYENDTVKKLIQHNNLGVTLHSNLSWKTHIFNIYEKASKSLNLLKGAV